MQTPAPAAVPTPPQRTTITGTNLQVTTTSGGQVIPVAPPAAPMTARDVEALRARRGELSNQLSSAEGRRNRLAEELQAAPEAAIRGGIQERIQLLDQRIVQLERDIAENGRLLSSPEAGLATTIESERPWVLNNDQITGIAIVFTIMVLAPLAFAAARLMWKRATFRVPKDAGEVAERLSRLEQAVDAVAIEVERISEGQRYVTRVLAGDGVSGSRPENARPALGAGQQPAEPIQVPLGERVGVPRRER